jgi:hypothetical protein
MPAGVGLAEPGEELADDPRHRLSVPGPSYNAAFDKLATLVAG